LGTEIANTGEGERLLQIASEPGAWKRSTPATQAYVSGTVYLFMNLANGDDSNCYRPTNALSVIIISTLTTVRVRVYLQQQCQSPGLHVDDGSFTVAQRGAVVL